MNGRSPNVNRDGVSHPPGHPSSSLFLPTCYSNSFLLKNKNKKQINSFLAFEHCEELGEEYYWEVVGLNEIIHVQPLVQCLAVPSKH